MLFVGFAVSVGALAILIGRRRDLSPRDYQRIRWVIWGCLIGLPAYLLAQLSQETSVFDEPARPGSHARGSRGRPLPRKRRPVPVRRRGRATADGGQRVDPAPPRDRVRPPAQRAGPLPPQADRDDRRVRPHARLGLGRGRFRSGLLDRARARVRDRAHGPAVRPRIHSRRAPSRRGGRYHSASRQPGRDRAPVGERADAFAGSRVGGGVSRAGRRLPPPRQRRMGP